MDFRIRLGKLKHKLLLNPSFTYPACIKSSVILILKVVFKLLFNSLYRLSFYNNLIFSIFRTFNKSLGINIIIRIPFHMQAINSFINVQFQSHINTFITLEIIIRKIYMLYRLYLFLIPGFYQVRSTIIPSTAQTIMS